VIIRAVLFDLDGTLADTAPDLSHALNLQLRRHGKTALPYALTRPQASRGARGLLEAGFGITPEHENFIALRDEFLDIYEGVLTRESRLFEHMADVLIGIEQRDQRWGIVTNKAARFTTPLTERLGLAQRSACVVSGDGAARAKPHPDTLLLAAEQIGISAQHCVYVGDDQRDAQAARAAGMRFVAARYGYLGNGGDPAKWDADAIIDSPLELLDYLRSQNA
jgi:N-acetyl-D-muramate 6-phosphate phosphatase